MVVFWSIWVCPLFGRCVYGVLLYWRPPLHLQGSRLTPEKKKKKPKHLFLQSGSPTCYWKIASLSTYPCQWVTQSVSQWVIVSDSDWRLLSQPNNQSKTNVFSATPVSTLSLVSQPVVVSNWLQGFRACWRLTQRLWLRVPPEKNCQPAEANNLEWSTNWPVYFSPGHPGHAKGKQARFQQQEERKAFRINQWRKHHL